MGYSGRAWFVLGLGRYRPAGRGGPLGAGHIGGQRRQGIVNRAFIRVMTKNPAPLKPCLNAMAWPAKALQGACVESPRAKLAPRDNVINVGRLRYPASKGASLAKRGNG